MLPFRAHAVPLAAAMLAMPIALRTGSADEPQRLPPPPAMQPATVPMRITPTEPKALSRPESWPSGKKPAQGNPDALGNHVLSSIRERPGSPLEPLDAMTPEKVAEGVVQTQYAEPFTPPASPSAATASTQELARLNMQSLETAMVVARVGPEVVLEGDLITPTAADYLAKVSPGLTPEQVRAVKLQIYKQVLKPHVEALLVYVDACRTIPEERLPDIEKKVNEAFDQQQLPRLIKEAGVANARDYEHLLKSRGQSLDRMRKMFFERALSQQWLQTKAESDDEIPHAEMIAWYENHLTEYDYPAKAKFEQLTVRTAPQQTRDQAWNKLAAMGNEVLQGADFAEVARTKSEGPTASTGGSFDWTTKGSLVSKVIDEALFTLPVGQLSAILDDGTGLHIIRVTERTDAGRIPFIEAQVGIREQLIEERQKRKRDEYLQRLRDRTPVWTMFDDETATASAGRGTSLR